MKNVMKVCLLMAAAASPVYAQSEASRPPGMNCPMMMDTRDVQKDMGAMMTEMRELMDRAADPATKTRMQRMHEHMTAMMANMQKMGGMMRGAADGSAKGAETSAAPSAPSTQDHEAHHPSP